MHRRTMVTAVGIAMGAIAGCLNDDSTGTGTPGDDGSDGEDTDGPIRERFADEPSRPECEKESESVEIEMGDETDTAETAATIPYPDPPTEVTGEAVLEYLEAFDEAYLTHDILCNDRRSGAILSIGYSLERRETFDWYDDVTVVFLQRAAGATSGVDEDGIMWQADIGYSSVVYAIDETGLVRAEVDDPITGDEDLESQLPDPLEAGTLVAAFE
ncbi:hypothetical protein [Halopiger goleimassiliensis]|uniref:hypothetical protein n=1 Tax=Halopiger goleimassiliensis TaxID=1293048 RepID=UPI000677793A|nr:hypothetical protein [Halopiger goleimassiliensis]